MTNATLAPKTLFRVSELVARWSMSRSKIYSMMDQGIVRSVKVVGSRRVPIDAVEEFESKLAENGTV